MDNVDYRLKNKTQDIMDSIDMGAFNEEPETYEYNGITTHIVSLVNIYDKRYF